jgi:cation diffusion facilitator family transporter
MRTSKSSNHPRGGETINEKVIIRRLSLVSVIGNAVLSGFKLFAGIYGHSGAMISDAVHSLSDVLTTIIAYFGVKMSRKAADKSHPFGHERVECIASLFLGVLLAVTGVCLGKVGAENIFSGSYKTMAAPGEIALFAAALSIISKEAMYWYTRHYAKLIHSSAFMADAWHHRSDALSSVGSLIGIAGAMMGLPVLDSAAELVICLFIFKVAFDILKDAVSKLLDTSCGESYENKLRRFIENQDGVLGVDSLRTRMFGDKVYIESEIRVDGDSPLRESHAIAERVHDSVEKNFPDIKHIMIHENPAERT